MLVINSQLAIPDSEIEIHAIRAQGAGGQNVNKVSSAVHLRFDIRASSLPEACQRKLLQCRDQRLTKSGTIVIKAQHYRTFEKNKAAACLRLVELIRVAIKPSKKRKPTRPSRSVAQRRMDHKTRRGQLKKMRRRPDLHSY